MNFPSRCLAALVLAAASENVAAEECVLPPESSMMAGLIAGNLEYMASSYPACAVRAPVDTSAMTRIGKRTSGSTLPDRCVIPASAVPFLGPCAGHLCAQVWEDVILCDRGGRPLPKDPLEGLPCYGSRIGSRIGGTGNVNRLTCMPRKLPHNPQDKSYGVWITSAEGFPPSKNPAARAVTVENLTRCDGDGMYGTAYAFRSREDICTRMGYSGGKVYAQCTARPCPSTLRARWPNGKFRCLNESDGGFMGTCLPGPYCVHAGGISFRGSTCYDGGEDVVDGVLPPGGNPYSPPNYSLTGTRYSDGGSLAASHRTPAVTPAPTHTPAEAAPEEAPAQTSGGSGGPSGFAAAPAPRVPSPRARPIPAVASPPAEDAAIDGPLAEQAPSDEPPPDE